MLGAEIASNLVSVVLLTLLVSSLVLWRYRRAVLSGMEASVGADLAVAPAAAPRPRAHRESDPADGGEIARLGWERRLRRRVYMVCLLATVPPSALLALYTDLLVGESSRWALLGLTVGSHCAIGVPMWAVLTATPMRRAASVFAVTLLALAACSVLLPVLARLAQGKAPGVELLPNFRWFLQYAVVTLWLPLLAGLVVGGRRVRGVAPITFAGLLVFGLAPLIGWQLTMWLIGTQAGTSLVMSPLGLDAGVVLLTLPVGLLAWQRLKALARAYDLKHFSDAQLLAHTWWLLVVVQSAVVLLNSYGGVLQRLGIVMVSALAYAMFPPLLAWGLRRARAAEAGPPPRTLLLLRVFGDTARTESLFDRIALRWQLFGPVTMIAAPDVVARTVDPGDFLRFALGHVGASFVNTQADLDRRLATLDTTPDPDGRYRLNEFCCRDSSWQATVVALMHRADAVVMDLRGFDAKRMGCEFELRQLASRLRPEQVVLVIDKTTDRALLQGLVATPAGSMQIVDLSPHKRDKGFVEVFRALLIAAA